MTAGTLQRTPAAREALERRTRRPTGKPSWPFLLVAGREGAGKSWACAQASASDLIGRTLWVGVGEDDPDEYALIPGADFEIVEHDGTYRDILAAIEWATQQDSPDGRPVLVVVDSATRIWDLLCDMAQDSANDRARRKQSQTNGSRGQSTTGDTEADIHMDLWNIAKGRWANIIDALRAHSGPVAMTARMDEVTVMAGGKPTTQKEWRIKAEKSLPYDVTHIVELPERGAAFLAKAKTARMEVPRRIPLPGFTVDKLWRDLGLADVEVAAVRAHSGIDRGARAPEPQQDQPAQSRPDQQDSEQTAASVAERAARSSDADELRRTYMGLRDQSPGLLSMDVAGALADDWQATAAPTRDVDAQGVARVELGAWLIACGRHVKEAGMSVADSAAADPALSDDPWAVTGDPQEAEVIAAAVRDAAMDKAHRAASQTPATDGAATLPIGDPQ